jgi:hypothetical protein
LHRFYFKIVAETQRGDAPTLSESSVIRLGKAGKLLAFSGQKRWIFLTGIGSPGKVGKNVISSVFPCWIR